MKKDQYSKLKLLYELLNIKFENDEIVTKKEIIEQTSWKISTFNTYYNKKMKDKILFKSKDAYIVKNINKYDESSFLRFMSQNQSKNEKPFKKDMKPLTEQYLEKSIESAYLAVDIYNRPQTKFRTDGYIVMMIIAWTSLLHSVFEENDIDYYYKESDGSYIIIDGDKKTWELSECIKNTDIIEEPIKDNLKFMIGLRNKIEHRFIPALDLEVCGECQAMLLNFEELLTKLYGNGYSLGTNIAIPLQLVNFNGESKKMAMQKFYNDNFDDIRKYICDFRNALSDDIYNDMRYSFKVFLVPKLKNHKNKNDISMEFLNLKDIDLNDYDEMLKSITLIKEKTVEIPVINKDKYKPSQVCNIVSKNINKEFKTHHHTNAWKYYGVRKKGYQSDGCKTQYCQFDALHQDYSYTIEWIRFLTDELSDILIYESIINYKEK